MQTWPMDGPFLPIEHAQHVARASERPKTADDRRPAAAYFHRAGIAFAIAAQFQAQDSRPHELLQSHLTQRRVNLWDSVFG